MKRVLVSRLCLVLAIVTVLATTGCAAGDPLQSAGGEAVRHDAGLVLAGERGFAALGTDEVEARLRAGDFDSIRVEVYLRGASPSPSQRDGPAHIYLVALHRKGSSLAASVLIVRHLQVGLIAGQVQGTFYSCGVLLRRGDGKVTSRAGTCPPDRVAFTARARRAAWPT